MMMTCPSTTGGREEKRGGGGQGFFCACRVTCILSPTEDTKTLAPYLRRKSIAPSNSRTRHTSLCLTHRACSREERTLLTSCLGAGRISSRANTSVAHSSCDRQAERRKTRKVHVFAARCRRWQSKRYGTERVLQLRGECVESCVALLGAGFCGGGMGVRNLSDKVSLPSVSWLSRLSLHV